MVGGKGNRGAVIDPLFLIRLHFNSFARLDESPVFFFKHRNRRNLSPYRYLMHVFIREYIFSKIHVMQFDLQISFHHLFSPLHILYSTFFIIILNGARVLLDLVALNLCVNMRLKIEDTIDTLSFSPELYSVKAWHYAQLLSSQVTRISYHHKHRSANSKCGIDSGPILRGGAIVITHLCP